MNEIVFKEELAPEIKRVKIMNPLIAKKSKSGQFVILRVERDGREFHYMHNLMKNKVNVEKFKHKLIADASI